MMNWGDFFSMDGRAFYVWGSFGAVAFAMMVEVVLLRLRSERAARAKKSASAMAMQK
jgi:heme exporter protein D